MPEVIFNGTEGRLEGRYHHSKTPGAPIALLLHPHPQHGGTMNNKVVYSLYQSYVQRGFSVLRFNFRGVGRSQGTFDNGQGELSDAASALDWMQSYNPNASGVWIGGFSFGAWIAMQLLMRRPEVVGFVAIAPPANMYDFTFLAPCPSSGLIVQGDKDEIVPAVDSKKLADKLTAQKNITVDYELIKDADHFFANKMDKVTGLVNGYMDKRLKIGRAHV